MQIKGDLCYIIHYGTIWTALNFAIIPEAQFNDGST